MHGIASAAGCSRATLYRYFENREALYTAYVHREAYRLYQQMTEQITAVVEPRERLIEGMLVVVAQCSRKPGAGIVVRHHAAPSVRRWPNSREVIKALTEAFLISMGPDEPEWSNAPGAVARAGDDVPARLSRVTTRPTNGRCSRSSSFPIVLPTQPERTG